jgi:hypothetical protein
MLPCPNKSDLSNFELLESGILLNLRTGKRAGTLNKTNRWMVRVGGKAGKLYHRPWIVFYLSRGYWPERLEYIDPTRAIEDDLDHPENIVDPDKLTGIQRQLMECRQREEVIWQHQIEVTSKRRKAARQGHESISAEQRQQINNSISLSSEVWWEENRGTAVARERRENYRSMRERQHYEAVAVLEAMKGLKWSEMSHVQKGQHMRAVLIEGRWWR